VIRRVVVVVVAVAVPVGAGLGALGYHALAGKDGTPTSSATSPAITSGAATKTSGPPATAASTPSSKPATSTANPNAPKPTYVLIRSDAFGSARQVVVQVNTTANLRAVFDTVVSTLVVDAGYTIAINCATGGGAGVDNRLANGRYAKGTVGADQTGLTKNAEEFAAVPGAVCTG
jgi:hypothetical protein